MKRRSSTAGGFTMIEIMIVVALLGMLVAIAIPNFMKARLNAQRNTCVNNLRVIDSIKQQWALENRKDALDSPAHSQLKPYLVRDGNAPPSCPAGGASAQFDTSYVIGNLQTPPTCGIVPTEHQLP